MASSKDPDPSPPAEAPASLDTREARLAAALRANLRRRKAPPRPPA
jgi:hypothetical protein